MKIVQVLILIVAAFILVIGAAILLVVHGLQIMETAIFVSIILVAIGLLYLAAGKLDSLQKQYAPPLATLHTNNSAQTSIFRHAVPMQDMNKTLYLVESVWPLKFFPCKLSVEEGGITVIRTTFFKVASTETILIQDLFSIVLNTGPVFASIDIQRRTSIDGASQILEVSYLPKAKAIIAKQIIDGLLLEHAGTIKVPKDLPIETRREILITAGQNKQIEHDVTR